MDTATLDHTVEQVIKLPKVRTHKDIYARKFKVHHQDDIRAKIKTDHIIARLQKHIDGEIDLQPTQVASAKILLDRVVPVLSATEVTRAESVPSESDLLAAIGNLLAQNPALLATLAQHQPALVGQCSTVVDATPAVQQPDDETAR